MNIEEEKPIHYLKRKNITCIKLHIINLFVVTIAYIVSLSFFETETIREALYEILLFVLLTVLAFMHCKIKEEDKYFKSMMVLTILASFVLTIHTIIIYALVSLLIYLKKS